MIDRRTFLLSTAALLAGVPCFSHARLRPDRSGFVSPGIELTFESVELLRQVLPRVQSVGLMHTPDDPRYVRQSLRLAEKIGVRFMPVAVRRVDDLRPAFGTLSAEGADALIVPAGLWCVGFHGRIVEHAAASRLPALYGAPGFAAAGGLVSLSPSRPDQHRRAATYVDKILKGAGPGDLPVEQPTKFELVINLKTAKALGLTVPRSIVLRADRVIE